jgi:hypothetical protein
MSTSSRSAATFPKPGGIELHTSLDASRLQALEHLFGMPGRIGIDLFTRLLSCALTMPAAEELSAPATGDRETYAALMSVESLSVLGKLIGCKSQETITKYVTLFATCKLIEKYKVKGSRRVYLAFPAGPYVPPSTLLADLDALLARPSQRPKVKALVRQVRERCITYAYISAETLGLKDDVPSSLQHLLDLLKNEQVDSSVRIGKAVGLLTKLIATTTTRASTSSVDATVVVDSTLTSSSPVDANTILSRGSRLTLVKSTSQVDGKSARPFNSAPLKVKSISPVDARTNVTQNQTPASPTEVDAKSGQSKIDASCIETSPALVDASKALQRNKPSTSTRTVDAKVQQHAIAGDSGQKVVDVSEGLNVNVYSFITENINVNVRAVTALMCAIFGEPPSKQGIYYKLFTQEQCNQPETITTAVLYALTHFHRDGTIQKPVSIFMARCRAFHHTGIPEEAALLFKLYGQLTHLQFLDEMRKPVSSPPGLERIIPAKAPGSVESRTISGKPAPAPLVSQPTMTKETKKSIDRQRMVMDQTEADLLMAMIRRGEHTMLFRTRRYRVSVGENDFRYVVLVDASLPEGPIHQTVVYSAREWQSRLETMKTWRDLFRPFPSLLPHPRTQKEVNAHGN